MFILKAFKDNAINLLLYSAFRVVLLHPAQHFVGNNMVTMLQRRKQHVVTAKADNWAQRP